MPDRLKTWCEFIANILPYIAIGVLGGLIFFLKHLEEFKYFDFTRDILTALFVSIILYLVVSQMTFLPAEIRGVAIGFGGYYSRDVIDIIGQKFIDRLKIF